MKYLLIMNPGSKSGRNIKYWEMWCALLKRNGINFDVVTTVSLEHAVQIAKDAHSYDTIVAVGGDGTINRVVHGVLDSECSNRRVGVLYSGTSPDFCKFHKIPIDPLKSLQALIGGVTKLVDVAKITYLNYQKQIENAYFTCSCNIGMGAEVARGANKLRRFIGDFGGTGVASIKAIICSKKIDLNINYDDYSVQLRGVNNFSAIINPFLASGMRLNLAKKSDDGKVALFAIKNRNTFSLIYDLPKFYSGSITSANDTFKADCNRLHISSDSNHEIEFDGDPRGYLPVQIEILPKKLNLIGGCNA